ncbi:hypothetical protein D9615_006103 [Tricholomella constricta]|uniref:Uncharacterized protein n=1 Tax=Tricholomella constricta TaxID=117010 RepID=A0A8H5HBB7_9AGAR|nr:hypothetical protein D9615_006103 [Tricholomella constricta]
MARSTSHKSQPVTPQRLPAQRPHHRYSSSQSFYKSPITPASPYTPLSLRSFTSTASGGSSTLTTPDHIGLSIKRLSFSPDVVGPATGTVGIDQSLADIAENWRSRASENGIKVSSMNDDSHFGDDEGMRYFPFCYCSVPDNAHIASERTLSDNANDSGFISTEEALLAPSLISNQRRSALTTNTRPRAQSHVPPPTSRAFNSPTYNRSSTRTLAQPTSPLVARRLNQAQNANVTSTPPPNRALARQLKLKGSFTDPAHTRRREAGPLRTPVQNNMNKTFSLSLNQDTTLDLFDIDENDFENDCDYNHGEEVAEDSLMDLSFHSKHSIPNNNTAAYGYPNYTLPLLPSYGQQQFFTSHSQVPFSDPFQGNPLSSITESVEHYFHTQQFGDTDLHALEQSEYTRSQPWGPTAPGLVPARPGLVSGAWDGYSGGPAWVPIPTASIATPTKVKELVKPVVKPAQPKKNPTQSGCSVCLAPSPRTLAVLVPCGHPLCSGCLTSALNIVGEKDMECAVCRCKVADFKLVVGDGQKPNTGKTEKEDDAKSQPKKKGRREWEKSFDEGTGKSFMDPLFSSPESCVIGGAGACLNELENAFKFGLGLEDVRASTPKREHRRDTNSRHHDHSVIDPDHDRKLRERGRGKGKGEENVVLRIDNVPWDITPPQIQKWLQHPLERVHVLLDKRGKTMSHAYVEVSDVAVAGKILRGEALGERPGGKPRERGSVLGKGRRARGVTVTRTDVTYAAVQMLLSRVNADPKSANDNEYSVELVSDLVKTALGCHAFTAQQLNKFTELLESFSLSFPSPTADVGSRSGSSARSEPRTPENRDLYGRVSSISTVAVEGEAPRLSPSPGGEGEDGETLAELAREFGVEAQLVNIHETPTSNFISDAPFFPPLPAAAKAKPNIDASFLRQLRAILFRIAFPSFRTKETAIVVLHSFFLVLRTVLSVAVARLDGRLARDLVSANGKGFLRGLGLWFLLAIPSTYTNSIIRHLQSKLSLSLRTRLTRYTHDLYLSSAPDLRYYRSGLEGVDQYITADIEAWSEALAGLYGNILKPSLDLILFTSQLSRSLGVRGTVLLFGNYYATVAILRAVTPAFGRLAAVEAKLEGEYRAGMGRIGREAEEIAFYDGGLRERDILTRAYLRLIKHVNSIYKIRIAYEWTEDYVIKYLWSAAGYGLIAVPLLYTRTKRSLGIQTGSKKETPDDAIAGRTETYVSNRRLLLSLADAGGRLMYAYKDLLELAGLTTRLYTLLSTLHSLPSLPNHTIEAVGDISLSHVDVVVPSYNQAASDSLLDEEFESSSHISPPLVKDLSLALKDGDHLMITGSNGVGKTAVARVLAGLWSSQGADADVQRPADGPDGRKAVFVVPQRAYMVAGSLLDQIIYPHSYPEYLESGKTEKDLMEILEKVFLAYLPEREGGWTTRKEWRDVLSGGEKQRMSMARVFYHRPRYAVLDECTSAVSSDVEGRMYEHAKNLGITLITISLRPSLMKYHTHLLTLSGDGSAGWTLAQVGTAEERMGIDREVSSLESKLADVEMWEERVKELDVMLSAQESA